MDYRVRNQDGSDERWVKADKLQAAAQDGFYPVVSSDSDRAGRRVKPENLAKALEAGFSPDHYTQQYGMAEATLAADKAGPQDPSAYNPNALEAAALSLGTGASLGSLDDISAGIGAVADDISGLVSGAPAGEGTFSARRDEARDLYKAAEHNYPMLTTAGEVLGGGAALAMAPATVPAQAGLGAAAGLMGSEADSALGLAADTTGGALLGGAVAKAAQAAQPIFKSIANSRAEAAAGLKETAEELVTRGKAATGDVGQMLRDAGVSNFGKSANKQKVELDMLANKAKQEAQEAALTVDEAKAQEMISSFMGKGPAVPTPSPLASGAVDKKAELAQYLASAKAKAPTTTKLEIPIFSKAAAAAKLWGKYGNSLAAAGFGSAEKMAALPTQSLQALAQAAARSDNSPSALMATHHIMLQKDPEYRKAVTESQDKKEGE